MILSKDFSIPQQQATMEDIPAYTLAGRTERIKRFAKKPEMIPPNRKTKLPYIDINK